MSQSWLENHGFWCRQTFVDTVARVLIFRVHSVELGFLCLNTRITCLQTPHSGADKCLSTPGWTLYTSMSPTPHQYLLSTSPAPPQHLPSTSPAPPQHLPSTSPPTQHLGMLRAVKSTCMLGAHMQAANLPGTTRGTEMQ